ncbi:adenylate/guanylate cyclase domain-containing protein [Ruegeria arenilitoris]|uniref:adenylate/guanylate cyclase domain-containing protein n=1 Tax=Ruegeria arenilitoris TaxID=1173585 RepID=UPI0014809F71|nr:adenylate/guanylate cyclase domain-containing protein [Ruegeria arenilitoris]
MERRLAAVMAADIVGYSRMMGADEDGTLGILRELKSGIIEPAIVANSGRLVKYMGDGFIAEFTSATATLDCARKIQAETAERNTDLPEEKRIRLRIGVNQGEIIIEDGDVYGDTVNIAARLEGLSPPEGIAVSEKVHAEVNSRSKTLFEDLGPQEFKNILRPVRVYCAHLIDDQEMGSIEVGRTTHVNELARPSIAVMPFRNMSGTDETDYLADGVTEEVVASLTRFTSLSVKGRNATSGFLDAKMDLQDIGRDLGVRYVLEGSVRTAGARVRISVQLMDAAAGTHIWADRYDRILDDIFDLQDEISQTIAARIQPELEHVERERSKRKPVNDLGAWDLYHRGMWRLYQFTPKDAAIARECFRNAIAADPEFAAAHAGLAYQLCYDAWNLNARDVEETISEAERYARRAITLDDRDVRARFTFGRVLQLKRDYPGAIREFTTGIGLSPAFAQMYHGLGFALVFSGDATAALPCFDTAIRLSPQDPQLTSFFFARAFAQLSLKDYTSAVLSAEAALAQPNAMIWASLYRTSALGHLGDPKAKEAVDQLKTDAPNLTQDDFRNTLFFAQCDEYIDHLIEGLRLAGLTKS